MENHWNRNILTIMQWENKQFERSSSYARQHIKAIASERRLTSQKETSQQKPFVGN